MRNAEYELPKNVSPMYLSEIWVYPVKSLAGQRVTQCRAGWAGLEYDRQWMITGKNGIFLTQRALPQMALIQAGVTSEGLLLSECGNAENHLLVPFLSAAGIVRQVKVWDDWVTSRSEGQQADHWLSERLGRAVSLVRMQENLSKRSFSVPDYPQGALSFADDFPYHLVSQSSIDDLNTRLDDSVSVRRFRPNFVIAGALPYADDHWFRFRMGDAAFAAPSRCDRCVMVNVDPATGEKGKQPLKSLASYRREDRKIHFGQNLIATAEGVVREGDILTVTANRSLDKSADH
ncbi:MOSC domain-containing protein [Dyadobacter sp. CY261]|uniref:MOSC domain-containing protein n=1 Tax=Dyadobacter sp. CY261 TaxID=2907203 RepID=UPI001F460C34|nr:MOSC N-terminal beta barrel domain-containing protein [Dyadobacter sp. CY261]